MTARPLAPLLFLSGAGALALEVAWFRRVAQLAGATSVAMAAVLAAVIGGMAAGAWLFGRVADRQARPLRFYALLEMGLAALALLTPHLLDLSRGGFDGLHRHLADTPAAHSVSCFLLATLLLAPPALLMGGTLPAVAAAVTSPSRRLGWLYAANTLGAVAGTFLAGFALLPALGLANTMRAAAVLPAVAGVIAWFLAPPAGERAPRVEGTDGDAFDRAFDRRAVALYAASGFLGLAAEVAFVRLLVLVFGSTTYAFTVMLGVFLLGIGLGGAAGSLLRPRDARRALATCVGATAVLFSAGALLVYLLPRLYLLAWTGPVETWAGGIWLRVGLASLVMLPGSIGLGAAFPLAARVTAHDARGAGALYAWNTAASILGSTVAVFWLVPAIGPQATIALGGVLAAAVALALAPRRFGVALLALAALGFLPPPETARERLLSGVYFSPDAWLTAGEIDERTWEHGVDLPFTEYGREATVAVWSWYGTFSVLLDGKAVATNQTLADDHHLALLGHVPMALHPRPRRVLLVGLGMGTTYRAVKRHGPPTLRVVELEAAVARAAAAIGVAPRDLVVADARSYLRTNDESWDVITSDPIHPWVRGGGDLYTVEYFESVRARLADGGVACQWLPGYQMDVTSLRDATRTFTHVFPHAEAYFGSGDLVLVGSTDPLPPPRRFDGRVRASLQRLGATDLSALRVAGRARLLGAAGEGPLLTDDALRLEFETPKHVENESFPACVRWIEELWREPPRPYGAMLEALRAQDRTATIRKLKKARALAPRHPYPIRAVGETYLGWAEALIRQGYLDEAEDDLAVARQNLGADDPRVLGAEADLRERQGRTDEARALFERLRKRLPDSRYLARRLAALD